MRRRKEGISIPMKYKANTDYQTIPDSLKPNAIAIYTTRPQGLSDFAVNMTNAVTNGDFSNGTTGWTEDLSTLSATGNTLSVLGTGAGTTPRAKQNTGITTASGKKVAVKLTYRVTGTGCQSVYVILRGATTSGTLQNGIRNTPTQNQVYTDTYVLTMPSDAAGLIRIDIVHSYADSATANGKVMEVQEVMCIDLSTPFGITNEPTATEFSDMLTYKGKTFWNGTENVVINPNDKYYWPDRSGLGRHLHAVNVAYDATGGVQAGPPANWLCDGVNDYLVFNSQTDIVPANGAVSAFVVFQAKGSLVANQTIFVISSSAGSKEVIAVYLPSGVVTGYSADSVTGFSAPSSGVTITPDKWYSVATMYDPSTKKAGISVNGGTIVWGSAITNGTSAPYRISVATNRAITSFFNDRVSEYPVFNKVLTQAEIKSLHNNIASRYGLTKV